MGYTGEHPGTHRVPRCKAAGLTRAGGCSGLCPWKAIIPWVLRCSDRSTELWAQPKPCEQGQDLGPQGVVEMLPACGAGKAGQAGRRLAADKQARGPSLVFPSQLSYCCPVLCFSVPGITWFTHCLMQAPQSGTLTLTRPTVSGTPAPRRQSAHSSCSAVLVGWMKEPIHPFTTWSSSPPPSVS